MADARLYIANMSLGIACKLYSRLGDAYSADDSIGLNQLLDAVKRELCIDDEFEIVDEGQLLERIPGTALWKLDPRFVRESMVPESQANRYRDLWTEVRKENVILKNKIATLGRQLTDEKESK